jgi:hypothetical protein
MYGLFFGVVTRSTGALQEHEDTAETMLGRQCRMAMVTLWQRMRLSRDRNPTVHFRQYGPRTISRQAPEWGGVCTNERAQDTPLNL